LPDGLGARLDLSAYERPAIFRVIAAEGPVEEAEMRRTFNLGVGLVVIVAPGTETAALEALRAAGEDAFRFGEVIEVGADVAFEDRIRFDR